MLSTDVICDIGLKRKTNEDSYLIDEKNDFAIVSDGMGGYEKGEIASSIIVEEFSKQLCEYIDTDSSKHTREEIIKYLDMANERSSKKISIYANNHNITKTMGATVVGLYFAIDMNKLVLFHMGDSRVYRISDNEIEQMTVDHSVNNNILAKAIGNFDTFSLDVKLTNFYEDDIYLICSDGVYNYISDEEMLSTIQKEGLNNSCKIIKDIIYKNGAKDNLTLIIAKHNKKGE